VKKCKHVGGLCLIDESKKAGKCVQTCSKCGWIRVHGERNFHPVALVLNPGEAPMRRTVDAQTGKDKATKCRPKKEVLMRARTDTRTWRVEDGNRAFAARFWEDPDGGIFVDSVSTTTGNPVFLVERTFDGAVFTPWDLFGSKVSS